MANKSQPTVATLTGSAVEQNDTEDAKMRMMVIIRKRVDKNQINFSCLPMCPGGSLLSD